MKAEGGWAAVCGGIISIRPDNWDGNLPRIWDEVDRGVLARMAAEVQSQGALAGIELGHSGATYEGGKFHPSLGATQLAYPDTAHLVPKEMSLDDIRSLSGRLGRRRRHRGRPRLRHRLRLRRARLPARAVPVAFFNRRADQYGGSLENRARFWLETLERFRADDRRSLRDRRPDRRRGLQPLGVSHEETLDFIRLADEFVDLWDINLGIRWSPDSAPSRLAPEGYQLEWSGRCARPPPSRSSASGG